MAACSTTLVEPQGSAVPARCSGSWWETLQVALAQELRGQVWVPRSAQSHGPAAASTDRRAGPESRGAQSFGSLLPQVPRPVPTLEFPGLLVHCPASPHPVCILTPPPSGWGGRSSLICGPAKGDQELRLLGWHSEGWTQEQGPHHWLSLFTRWAQQLPGGKGLASSPAGPWAPPLLPHALTLRDPWGSQPGAAGLPHSLPMSPPGGFSKPLPSVLSPVPNVVQAPVAAPLRAVCPHCGQAGPTPQGTESPGDLSWGLAWGRLLWTVTWAGTERDAPAGLTVPLAGPGAGLQTGHWAAALCPGPPESQSTRDSSHLISWVPRRCFLLLTSPQALLVPCRALALIPLLCSCWVPRAGRCQAETCTC